MEEIKLTQAEKFAIVSKHMRDLQAKSVKVVKEKHGIEFYKKIGKLGGQPSHKNGRALFK